jgi:hypothetical protein
MKLLPEEIAVFTNCSKFLHPCNFSCDANFTKKYDKKIWTFFLVLIYFQCPQCYFIYFILVKIQGHNNSIVLFKFLPNHTKHKSEINTLVPWQLFLTQKNYILFVEMLK